MLIIFQDSFPNLENLTLWTHADVEIWYDILPAEFFSKLKYLVYYSAKSWPAALLEKLLNLEKLELYGPAKEIFVLEGNSSEEIHAVRTQLPHLRSLELIRMPMLMHLGKENCRSAGPVFPNLEILDVWLCGKLKNLRSSAISFQHLTTLKVARCHGMEYLITCSMAKSFVQLKSMEVEDCSRVMEIVAFSNENDAGNDISFSRLQHCVLSDLPSMQRFCWGDCTVKLPSIVTLTITGCPVMLTISPDGVLLSGSKLEIVQRKRKRNDYDDETVCSNYF